MAEEQRPDAPERAESRLTIEDNARALLLYGRHDENLRLIEAGFDVRLVPRGNELVIAGARPDVERVRGLVEHLLELTRHGSELGPQEVRYGVRLAQAGDEQRLAELFTDVVIVTARGRPIRPKSLGQKEYVEAMRRCALVFGIGPAGTGKTYLAMAMAIAAFKNREVNRIVLTRPAVEAGERLGFLPGGLEEKVNPYLRPLYDAMYDILGVEAIQKFMERGSIEVAPLAYMRGRTLDDAFIILDEAQNTTSEQMKMFLTRMGFGSRVVVTGDITQIDLPRGTASGLVEAREVLRGAEGIAFATLTELDVVRHELVSRVIRAYERYERRERERGRRGEGEGPG